jgi:hypothetical protein
MTRQRRTYYLVSTAGIPNLGDELIAATWLHRLAMHAPDDQVVLDCVDPTAVSPRLLAMHPNLRVVSTLWQLCFRYWDHGAGAAERVAAAITAPAREPDLAPGIDLLLRADVVHLTGGGFLNRLWTPFLGLLGGLVAVGERAGARTAVTGVGLCPPDPDSADLLTDLVSRIPVVDVRDEASAKLLRGHVTYSCDDAFLNPLQWCDQRYSGPEVMVSVQFTLQPGGLFPPSTGTPAAPTAAGVRGAEQLLDQVERTLDAWGADDVGLLECWPVADKHIGELARRRFPQARPYSMAEMVAHGVPAYPGQSWLSTRFHPHVFAAAGGASGVAVSLAPDYYGTKHGSLIEQGSNWSLLEWPLLTGAELAVPDRPQSTGFDPRRLAQLRSRKCEIAELIYQ